MCMTESKLSNTFKSVKNVKNSSQTVSKYLYYLTESFLLNKAIRYDIKGKKNINTLSKYYFSDIGLRNAIFDMRQQEESLLLRIFDSALSSLHLNIKYSIKRSDFSCFSCMLPISNVFLLLLVGNILFEIK